MNSNELLKEVALYSGSISNVSSHYAKENQLIIIIKNRSLIQIESLKALYGKDNVELNRNRLSIVYQGLVIDKEENNMAKIDHKQLADDIVRLVGGPTNVEMVTHCVTRLRFMLKDVGTAKTEEIKALPGVLGVVYAMEQYQVILGENLFQVYDAVEKNYDLKTGDVVDENHTEDLNVEKNFKYYFTKVITFMAQSLTPFITVLYGAGMLRVVMSLGTYFKLLDSASSTYKLFNIVAQTPFYFMPVLVAFGASKVLKSNPVFAMTIALALVYPDWTAMVSAGEPVTLFGIGVKLLSYSSSLLPAIFAAILCAFLEKWFYKHIPGVLRSVFAPLCIFLVAFPITLWVLGPIGNVVGSVIVNVVVFLEKHSGGLAPGLIAAAHPFLVMMGVNMLMVPPMTELFTAMGYDNVFRPGWILHNIAEGGACFAVMLKTKDGDLKSTALSAGIGAFVSGVSEPALYGIGMKYKTPIIGVVAGGFVGGAVAGLLGAKAFSMGYSSVLGVVIFEQTMYAIIIAVLVATVVSFVVTYILFKDEKK